MFAVTTHSRLRHPRFFPAMLRATLGIRRDLRHARGLIRAANVIAGPTEFLTLTVWTHRDAMYEFMSSGAHERIMWRWPEWLSSFWLGRLAPAGSEVGSWRGIRLAPLASRGGPAHAQFPPPAFASREPRPRDLERFRLGAAAVVSRPASPVAWPATLRFARRLARQIDAAPRLLLRAGGYSLDGELVSVSLWRDERSAADLVERARAPERGVRTWAMVWRPLDEFGLWDGVRVRHLCADARSTA